MLKQIWVDNFRSLEDFHLRIEPGLNVLVGPNGAGKTSIMKWFEFLSLLSTYSLRESIGKIGGANHVFRRKNEKYSDALRFSIEGETKVENQYYTERKKPDTYIKYHYSGEISILKNQIFFSKQVTTIWIGYGQASIDEKKSPNIKIEWHYDILEDKINSNIKLNKPKNIKNNDIERYIFDNPDFVKKFLETKENIEHMLIPNRFFPVDFLYAIKDDINYKKAFNINPSSVRSAIDISSQPGVQFDGAGLVSTLYDIKSHATQGPKERYLIDRDISLRTTQIFPKVLAYFKLSDQNISNIDATIDNFRNEFILEVEYEYESGEGSYRVPVFLLSDGTVKWLAIVTALSTEQRSLFIEEPENFLHPRLQENIVEIIREEINNSAQTRFAIMTTHSETLLNKLKPEEVIVTNMLDGKTISARVEDPEELSKIIADSGFGLGYFYVSGGL